MERQKPIRRQLLKKAIEESQKEAADVSSALPEHGEEFERDLNARRERYTEATRHMLEPNPDSLRAGSMVDDQEILETAEERRLKFDEPVRRQHEGYTEKPVRGLLEPEIAFPLEIDLSEIESAHIALEGMSERQQRHSNALKRMQNKDSRLKA